MQLRSQISFISNFIFAQKEISLVLLHFLSTFYLLLYIDSTGIKSFDDCHVDHSLRNPLPTLRHSNFGSSGRFSPIPQPKIL